MMNNASGQSTRIYNAFPTYDVVVGTEPCQKSGSVCFLVMRMPEACLQSHDCGVEMFFDLRCVKPAFHQAGRS